MFSKSSSTTTQVNKYFWDENSRRKSLPRAPTQEAPSEVQVQDLRYFFELVEKMERNQQIEHFQPPEFPLIPVIRANTHSLTTSSWKAIAAAEYNDPDGLNREKIKGSVYFYNRFFDLLFTKSTDFKSKFPNIQTQAHVMSNIIALCVAVKLEEIELIQKQLIDLGIKHQRIVYDPWQFSIFATTIHSTIKLCLGDLATPEVMTAWLNVLAFVLRSMMPSAITHIRPYAGAVNAAGVIAESDQAVIKVQDKIKELRSSGDRSEMKTPDVRKKGDNIGLFNQRDRSIEELSRNDSVGNRQSSGLNASLLAVAELPGAVNKEEKSINTRLVH